MNDIIDYIHKYLGYQLTPTPYFNYDSRLFFAKDERARCGLNSFKALGAFYATCKLALAADNSTRRVITATAGNHGIGVAYACKVLGLRCQVYVPDSTPVAKIRKMRAFGAAVTQIAGSYEQVCRQVDACHVNAGTVKVLDFDAHNSPDSVTYVRQGYQLIAAELADFFRNRQTWPDHVYLQGGVGTFAAALTDYIRHYWPSQPNIIVVEPQYANCLQRSAVAGQPQQLDNCITGAMQSIDCKQASASAVQLLAKYEVRYNSIDDHTAKQGCAALATFNLETTLTGAAGFAAAINDMASAGQTALVIITEDKELKP